MKILFTIGIREHARITYTYTQGKRLIESDVKKE